MGPLSCIFPCTAGVPRDAWNQYVPRADRILFTIDHTSGPPRPDRPMRKVSYCGQIPHGIGVNMPG
jgi:hypothetical protein